MKGTILDFLNLATEKTDLAQELVALAAKHDFKFVVEELTDAELDDVSGGVTLPTVPLDSSPSAPTLPTDINALVQSVLRIAYLDQPADLQQAASDVSSLNVTKGD